MPTSGTNRPGPLGAAPLSAPAGVRPTHLKLERLGIDATVDVLTFLAGAPTLPVDPELVAWFRRSAPVGVPGVVLIGGSSAIDDTGPSALTRLSEVLPGDIAVVTGANGGRFHYIVERSEVMTDTPDFKELLALTDTERFTLLAWSGSFVSAVAAGGVHEVTGIRVMATPPGD